MGNKYKILTLIVIVMMIVLVLGININTHICGQTENVSKSLVIPGILSPKECNNCHKEVVVVKSCCSNKKNVVQSTQDNKAKKKNCCKDLKEYNDYEYLNIRSSNIRIDYSDSFLSFKRSILQFVTQESANYQQFDNSRRRPYVVDILSFICSYLI
jgi:hypothetical protein